MSKDPKDPSSENRVVARNRRARHDYHIEETVEAGIVLQGTEVKTLRQGRASITHAFARVQEGEVWLLGANIPQYGAGGWTNHDPKARRKLLLHRRQIRRLESRLQARGRTLIPLQIHFTERGIAKVLLGIALGKKHHDKRQDQAAHEARREIEQALRRRR